MNEERTQMREMARGTPQSLHAVKLGARSLVEGRRATLCPVAVNNATGSEIFMEIAELQGRALA